MTKTNMKNLMNTESKPLIVDSSLSFRMTEKGVMTEKAKRMTGKSLRMTAKGLDVSGYALNMTFLDIARLLSPNHDNDTQQNFSYKEFPNNSSGYFQNGNNQYQNMQEHNADSILYELQQCELQIQTAKDMLQQALQ